MPPEGQRREKQLTEVGNREDQSAVNYYSMVVFQRPPSCNVLTISMIQPNRDSGHGTITSS